jgi:hypothetical protein
MAFVSLQTTAIATDKFLTNETMTYVKDDLDYLYGHSLSAVGIINGSFEIDSDLDGTPDSWTVSLYPGGSFVLTSTVSAHGAKAASFIHPGGAGNGGGTLTSDYFAVNETSLPSVVIGGVHWVNNPALKCEVIIKWYNSSYVSISDETLYSSTANSTAMEYSMWSASAPAGAKYAKIQLIGGKDDADATGIAYFDNFDVSYMQYMPIYSAPSTIYTIGSAAGGSSTSTSYDKVIDLECTCNGTLRIGFVLARAILGTTDQIAYGQLYRNGSAIGTEQTSTSMIGITFSEDISGWKIGDRLQLYIHINNMDSTSNLASGGALTVKSNIYPVPFIDLST